MATGGTIAKAVRKNAFVQVRRLRAAGLGNVSATLYKPGRQHWSSRSLLEGENPAVVCSVSFNVIPPHCS